jgi:hypothetical protein
LAKKSYKIEQKSSAGRKMKQSLPILVIILTLGGVCFGQLNTKNPHFVFVEFWDYALENNTENAKKLVSNQMLTEESFQSIGKIIQLIVINKLKIYEVTNRSIFGDSAFFEVKAIDKAGKYWDAQILLVKERAQWKIHFLYFQDKNVLPPTAKPPSLQKELMPAVPNRFRDYQLKKDCPKCT